MKLDRILRETNGLLFGEGTLLSGQGFIEEIKPLVITAVGDSLTAGFGALAGEAYPAVLADRTGLTVNNSSLTGRKLVTMDADYDTLVTPLYDADANNVLVLLAGSNDILNEGGAAATLSTMTDALVSFLGKATTTGFSPWVCTIPVWGGIDDTKTTRREEYNAWIRANAVSNGAAGVIDVNALDEFQRPYENYYWNADLVHLTAVGYAHLADAVGTALGLGMTGATLYRPTSGALVWGTTSATSITVRLNMNATETVVATYQSAVTGATITANLGADADVTTDISSLPAPRIVSIPAPVTPANCVALIMENAAVAGRLGDLTGYSNLSFLTLTANTLSGPTPNLTGKPLVIVSLSGNKFTGDLPAMPDATGLFLFNVEANQFRNAIPSFSANTALVILNLKGNLFTTYAGAAMPATVGSLDASDNLLAFGGAVQVNNILTQIDTAGGVGPDKIIVLTGANMPAPTGAGATAVTSLVAKDWFVLTE